MLGEPAYKLVSVLDGCLAEAQKLANLSAVVFDRAARPLVARVQIGRYVDLVGDVDDDHKGHIMLLPRKASFNRECFQQNREPEPRRAALVGEQLEFCWAKESSDLPARRASIAASSGPPFVQHRWPER